MPKKEINMEKIRDDACIKLGQIFKDAYVINGRYILEGPVTRTSSYGIYTCVLENIYAKALEDDIKESDAIYIPNIKNFRFKEGKYIEKITEEDKPSIVETILSIQKEFQSIENWLPFRLSGEDTMDEETIEHLFVNNGYVWFTPQNIDCSVILSKFIIPLLSKSNYTNLFYHTKKNNEKLYTLYFDFIFPNFREQLLYKFIPVELS